ncbi:hypothetical protein [Roseateles violae]|uniref:TubC N-terminal docking domain-containing protein n=1 Tax=Roseateles violae TaxID=3058042 RepID=A0ABT8DU17_9BURK|nr:hypothetical protein [Pelomonas sp. PFR6]MDN3920404.1 hypothetical protein [Pelomonas sp. PFR6]
MGAHELLLHLRGAGLDLAAEGDRLTVAPRELLTDAMRAAIKMHKPALLEALRPGAEEAAGCAAVGDSVLDDRIVCTDCLHFRPNGMQCRNRWVAGVPRELGADLATKPQRCPGFRAAAARHAH